VFSIFLHGLQCVFVLFIEMWQRRAFMN